MVPPLINMPRSLISLQKDSAMSEDQALSIPSNRSLVIASVEGGATLTFSASERDCDFFLPISRELWGCNIVVQFGQFMMDEDHIIRRHL